MTTAADFKSLALYPGGQGKCKVGTADLYPSEPWYVNVSMADLHKWMWNLEDWSSNLDSDLEDTQSATLQIDADISLSGKNHYGSILSESLSAGDEWSGTGRALITPPNKRVCGAYFQTVDDQTTTPTNSTGSEERLLPYAENEVIANDGAIPASISASFNISDGTSTVGTVSFTNTCNTGSVDAAYRASIDFYYIRLLGNGTADVYFTAEVEGTSSFYSYHLSRLNDWLPFGTDPSFVTGSSISLSVLGKTASAYISVWDATESATPSAITSFSFTYAIAVTTAYTY